MHEEILVSIYTQVYNSRDWIDKCVQSVLNQTHKNLEYVLIDNGCTDGCKEILEQYARQDNRITLIRYEKNILGPLWLNMAHECMIGKYIVNLDSDDWLELDYLEKLIDLCEKNDLDMVCTGSLFHKEGEGFLLTLPPRAANQQIIMDRGKMLESLRYYYLFFVTTWGKLFRRDMFCKADFSIVEKNKIFYGADTIIVFACLQHAKKVCIDNSVLHHYLVREKSFSYVYDPKRYKFAICLYQTLVDFLSNEEKKITMENLGFAVGLLATHMNLAVCNIYESELSPKKKLKKIAEITNLQIAQELFILDHPDAKKFKADVNHFINQLKHK